MPHAKYSHIIWDWNGTLLDDAAWAIAQMNQLLVKRNKPLLADMAAYHRAFCFPITDYYQHVGFDFSEEPFEVLAQEFISLYHGEGSTNLKLHDHAEYVLRTIQGKQFSQSILSASFQDNLVTQLAPYGIRQYFDEILGIADVYGKSKVEIGLAYLERNNVQNGLLIGDTVHDFEVAQAMRIHCVLIAHGHQSKDALLSCNVPVFDHLDEVLEYLL